MSVFGLKAQGAGYVRAHRYRFLLPVLPWRRRGYDVNHDIMVGGWWVWSVGLSCDRIGTQKETFGLNFGVTWGWVSLEAKAAAAAYWAQR